MFELRTATLAVGLCWAAVAAAQSAGEEEDLALAYGDKDFVSIATGSRQPIRQAPAAATVITAEDIAAMGARDIDQALESVSGLHVMPTHYGQRAYAIRGIARDFNPQVLMMLNGVPMTSVYLGNRGSVWGGLPLDNVARIEVIRGPGSALYGADAFAGTINIVTKTAGEAGGTQAGLRAGSFATWDTWLSHGSRQGELEIAGYLRLGSTDGPRRTLARDAASGTGASLAPGPMNDGYDAVDGHLDLAYGKFRWRTDYSLRDNFGTAAGIADALDPWGRSRNERLTSDLSWHDPEFARNWSLTVQASTLHQANTNTSPLVLFPPGALAGFPDGMLGAPSQWERQNRAGVAAVFSGWQDHRLRLGAGHDELEIYKVRESKNFAPDGSSLGSLVDVSATAPFLRTALRRVDYAYIQDEWSLARDWTLTAGLRHDRYSDFGGTTNPRLALVWEARHDLTLKTMYGTAFRAPSFAELYAINNPVRTGNPALQPERIETLEAAAAWQLRRDLALNLSLFRHRQSDIIGIVTNPVPNTGATFQNGGRHDGKGGEIEINWQVHSGLRLSAYYAHQRTIDQTTRQDAGYAPHHHAYARADWDFVPGWKLSGQVNYVADRRRAAGDSRPQLPDYATADLTLRSEPAKQGWDFAATVRNLFDTRADEPLPYAGTTFDLPLPGRSFWLQARYGL